MFTNLCLILLLLLAALFSSEISLSIIGKKLKRSPGKERKPTAYFGRSSTNCEFNRITLRSIIKMPVNCYWKDATSSRSKWYLLSVKFTYLFDPCRWKLVTWWKMPQLRFDLDEQLSYFWILSSSLQLYIASRDSCDSCSSAPCSILS